MTLQYAQIEWRRGVDLGRHVVSERQVGRYRFGLCGRILAQHPDGHGIPPRMVAKCRKCVVLLPQRVR